jgi:hypothetical protein
VVDDWSALVGLLSYRYICKRLGMDTEEAWADQEYTSLLASTDKVLTQTVTTHGLDYIPCSILEPNESNRCTEPRDANWASMFHIGRWSWDGLLLDGEQYGAGIELIDGTYDRGFRLGREAGVAEHCTGGFPTGWYATGYNGAQMAGGLRGEKYRSEGLYAIRFLLDSCTQGPNCTFEGISEPGPTSWEGTHPRDGYGACPHAWGIATNFKVFVESFVAERVDGTVIIGRGIPDDWVRSGDTISVSNFAIGGNKRMGYSLRGNGDLVTVTFSGDNPSGEKWIDLPSFIEGIHGTSAGVVDEQEHRVKVPANVREVTIGLSEDGKQPVVRGVPNARMPDRPAVKVFLPDGTIVRRFIESRGKRDMANGPIHDMPAGVYILATDKNGHGRILLQSTFH